MKRLFIICILCLAVGCSHYVKRDEIPALVKEELKNRALSPEEVMDMATEGRAQGFQAYSDVVVLAPGDVGIIQDVSDPTDDVTYGTTKYFTISELLTLIDTYYDTWAEHPELLEGEIIQGNVSDQPATTSTLLLNAIEVFELSPSALNDTSSPHDLQLYEMKNTMITDYAASKSADSDFDMSINPTGEDGLNFMIMCTQSTYDISVSPYTGEAFILNGVTMASDEDIVNEDCDLGEYLLCFSIQTGSSTYDTACYSAFTDWAEDTP